MSNNFPQSHEGNQSHYHHYGRLPEGNPFRIPTDEEVFMMRDEEKRRRKEERKKTAQIPVHEKTTWSTRLNIKRHNDKELEKTLKDTNSVIHSTMLRKQKESDHPSQVFPPIQRISHERENMAQFIEKKRQMFLIQMSLDTKKQEIRKLEKKAEEREKKLKQEEDALRRDAQRFDNFLTNNDIQAVQAIQRAEEETKAKQTKQNEIKKLNTRQTAIKNDISRLKDQLAKCMTYKNFLDSLTPESWFAEREREVAAAETDDSRGVSRNYSSQRSSPSNISRQNSTKATLVSQLSTRREEVENLKNDEKLDMYFTKPEQLLSKFTALEEENLFLIQSSQEIDEQLDELKKQERETKEKMDKQAEDLRKQIETLDKQIVEEMEQKEIIQRRLLGSNDKEGDEKLKNLKKKIKEIFEASCDASMVMDDPDPIYMLTQIEFKLEGLLSEMGELKDDFVMKHERARDKERRKHIRDAKNNMSQLAPSRKPKEKGPVKQRLGKPLMQRSHPIDAKKTKEENLNTEQEDQLKRDEFKELFAQ